MLCASIENRAEAPVSPAARIAGGFVLVPVAGLMAAWWACRARPLGVADFRTWLACREMVARRQGVVSERSPSYSPDELAALLAVSPRRARASLRRLVDAGLLRWSAAAIEFPDPPDPPATRGAVVDSIGRGRGSVAIPRRVLRFLARGARPSLIAVALAVLLRCLSRRRGGWDGRGRLKIRFVAEAFGVSHRQAQAARRELVRLGWIAPEPGDARWAMNRYGPSVRIDLGWAEPADAPGARSSSPRPGPGARSSSPESDLDPLREQKHQEPGRPGPPGARMEGTGEGEGIRPPSPDRAPRPVGTFSSPPAPAPALAPIATRDPGSAAGESRPMPPPRLSDVRVEDLRDVPRLLDLHRQAEARGLVGASEAGLLGFVALAEHAKTVGTTNPGGLFASLLRRQSWSFVTQDEEDAAALRLKRHRFGGPREAVGDVLRPGRAGGGRPSPDAEIVREVRAATIRAGIYRDPFPTFQGLHPEWSRERWDAALAELGLS